MSETYFTIGALLLIIFLLFIIILFTSISIQAIIIEGLTSELYETKKKLNQYIRRNK